MRLTRKRALAPEALALSQAPRDQAPAPSASMPDHARALETIEATMLSIDAIEHALVEARELVADARHTEAHGKRVLLAERLSWLRGRIDEIAAEGAGPLNLIDSGRDTLELSLDPEGRECLRLEHFNLTAGLAGLGLSQVSGKFAEAPEIERMSKELEAARAQLHTVTDTLRKSAMRIADQLGRAASLSAPSPANGAGEASPQKISRLMRKPITP
jgi:hypothetical protein